MSLRRLWRLRALTGAALLFAIVAGLSIPYHLGLPPKSRQHEVGIASASALIDTPRSQVADLGDTGSDVGSLSARASLLASLMASSPIKDEIARRAGIPVAHLIATPPPSVGPTATKQPGVLEASVSADDPRANVLSVTIPTLEVGQLPILAIDTQAADAAGAARLADASIAVLGEHVKSVAGTDGIPDGRRLVVTQLGPARAADVTRGPRLLFGVLATILIFGLACAAILGASSLAGAWRDVSEYERGALDGPGWDAPPADDVAAPAPAAADRPAPVQELRAAAPPRDADPGPDADAAFSRVLWELEGR